MFTEHDLQQIKDHSLSVEQIERQLDAFKKGSLSLNCRQRRRWVMEFCALTQPMKKNLLTNGRNIWQLADIS